MNIIKQPHISYPYNPIIADVLYKTTFLENWGSGAGRIIDACRAQGVAEPTWDYRQGFVVVTFKRTSEPNNDILEVPHLNSTEETAQKTTQKIISAIKGNPHITMEELSLTCGLSVDGVKWNLKQMKNRNLIRRVGPDNGGHWEVIENE